VAGAFTAATEGASGFVRGAGGVLGFERGFAVGAGGALGLGCASAPPERATAATKQAAHPTMARLLDPHLVVVFAVIGLLDAVQQN
jgi:hypothetical protein